MRIISGRFKGRRFSPPAKKWPTRPTTDMAKEGLYNMLQNKINFESAVFLDLFGGTGNHCYEFISRGCTNATYVDRHGPAVGYVRSMAVELAIDTYLKIYRDDVFRFIKKSTETFSVIFAGPPYPLQRIPEIPDLVLAGSLLREDGLFILEHNSEHTFSHHPKCTESRNYGDTWFSFFTKNSI
ncbi:RsmD family RNA methyltransferase [Membranicola marinus]|uniref:RsmD family RNA methyltransferase n=1 Tax=Membranihabitans marinus TaxID=1227546 RepID=A0A953HXA2_9BACT|nr:RsmD family RNA methyltransferase [Membranihabitans marinus]MBY5960185.1 RsmD family RNA methyltransferase [Membranihabitans marinus]